MKQVCTKKCQLRLKDDKCYFVQVGTVVDFDDEHPCLRKVDGEKLDFSIASKDELMEADFELDNLKEFIKDKYDKTTGRLGLKKTIEVLLDCRYREV